MNLDAVILLPDYFISRFECGLNDGFVTMLDSSKVWSSQGFKVPAEGLLISDCVSQVVVHDMLKANFSVRYNVFLLTLALDSRKLRSSNDFQFKSL